jgi:predicted homoserine dehydrogenase-like protein
MLYEALKKREAEGQPIRVGVIGAGTFGTQIIAQLCRMTGVRATVVGELNAARAYEALRLGGADATKVRTCDSADSINDAQRADVPAITDNIDALVQSDIDVVVEATGNVHAGTSHAWRAIEATKHVVMVTVEADVVVGHRLKQKADAAGVIYSMAYGDEPAVAYDLWDWARTLGFRVVAAGKGTRFLPAFRKYNPDDVASKYGFTGDDYNAQMFGSFLDGTKHSIEMTALSNATGLVPDVRGMHFPSADLRELPDVLCSKDKGGILGQEGVVEAISACHPDESPVDRNLRGGLYAIVDAPSDYCIDSLASYGEIIGVHVGERSRYAMVYRPHHLIGHEMPMTVARLMIHGQACGTAMTKTSEVMAAAKRPLKTGEVLDGEGGFTAYGMIERADIAKTQNLVPMGLTHGATVCQDIAEDDAITFDNVKVSDSFVYNLWKGAGGAEL